MRQEQEQRQHFPLITNHGNFLLGARHRFDVKHTDIDLSPTELLKLQP